MKETPLHIYHYFVVNRDDKTTLRYQGFFIPRIGDTFMIGEYYLKVVDVIIETARMTGEGVQHALWVHVKKTKKPFDDGQCQELELNEFCDRMKPKAKPIPVMKNSPIARKGLQNL